MTPEKIETTLGEHGDALEVAAKDHAEIVRLRGAVHDLAEAMQTLFHWVPSRGSYDTSGDQARARCKEFIDGALKKLSADI